MWRIFVGAALVVAGIAAFIEAHSHAPAYKSICRLQNNEPCPEVIEGGRIPEGEHYVSVFASGHLTQTPYDLLRIGAWALLIVGGLLVIVGLIGYWARVRRSA